MISPRTRSCTRREFKSFSNWNASPYVRNFERRSGPRRTTTAACVKILYVFRIVKSTVSPEYSQCVRVPSQKKKSNRFAKAFGFSFFFTLCAPQTLSKLLYTAERSVDYAMQQKFRPRARNEMFSLSLRLQNNSHSFWACKNGFRNSNV